MSVTSQVLPAPLAIFREPTGTPIPKPTQTATLTTIPPSPTATLTSLPRMSRQDAQAFAAELFRTNGNCTPPCFWGIVPDKTTLDEAAQFLNSFCEEGTVKKNPAGEIYHYDNGTSVKNGYLKMSVILGIQYGIADTIQVYMGGFFEPGVEPEDWAAYSLKGMLEMYGVSSRVRFFVDYPHEPVSNTGKVLYSYLVFFDSYHVVIAYSQVITDDAALYPICPLSPSQEPPYLNLWLGEDSLNGENIGGIDLTQATNLSYENFYKLFTPEGDGSCFYLRRDAFESTPTPTQ